MRWRGLVRLLWLGGVLAVLTLAAQPAAAVTSWEPVSGDIHEADAAIIPGVGPRRVRRAIAQRPRRVGHFREQVGP
jgi:hypothetical protein